VEPGSPAPTEIKAPWLIIWLQVLLRHFPPLIAGFAFPMAALIFAACLPWIPHFGGHDPLKQYQFGFHQIIFIAMASVLVFLTFWGL
jgi:quinol-cytochrome oxidoreductase complex cytochrome b subunit